MENNEQVINSLIEYCRNKPGAYEARPFGMYPISFKLMGKIFVQINPEEHFYKLTVKCEPERGMMYRDIYPGVVVRGFHTPPVQQPYWNTIDMYEFEDMEMLFNMIDEAYEAVVNKLRKKDRQALEQITQLTFCDTDSCNRDFAALCDDMNTEMINQGEMIPDIVDFESNNIDVSLCHVLIMYRGEEPVGCGEYQRCDDEHAEITRIYVKRECRGMGFGAEIIRRLEAEAKMAGFKWFIFRHTADIFNTCCHMLNKLGYVKNEKENYIIKTRSDSNNCIIGIDKNETDIQTQLHMQKKL